MSLSAYIFAAQNKRIWFKSGEYELAKKYYSNVFLLSNFFVKGKIHIQQKLYGWYIVLIGMFFSDYVYITI